MIDRESIALAGRRLRGFVRETPVIEVGRGSFGVAHSLNIKLECLQHSGSFKVRGVFNHLLDPNCTAQFATHGVVAASGGNHGAAVAYGAQQRGVRANIFVPSISQRAKIDRIKSYDAKVHVKGADYSEALRHCQAFQEVSGGIGIHAYDQEKTLNGQGTLAQEWQMQCPKLDTVLVAVGGGGLIGGMAGWYQGQVKLVACEPEKSCAYHAASQVGHPVDVSVGGIAADSLGAKRVGALMFPLAQKYIAESIVVSDDAIEKAQRALWAELQVVAEPGGATALAALMSCDYRVSPNERVGVLVCGGNVSSLPSIL